MSDKVAFKFIRYPYESGYVSQDPGVLIEHSVFHQDITVHELLEVFELFLKASGYHFKGTLDIVENDE